MSSDYLVETGGTGVTTITLNRPDSLNALNDGMFYGLAKDLLRIGRDPGVGAVILTGAGRAFSAGGDVKGMKGSASGLAYEERVAALRSKHELVRRLHELPQVTVAAVNGVAAGAGLALALACDMRFAARSASFLTSFVKVGFAGDLGGTYFLTHLLGAARAKELYLTSDRVDAGRALALGLVSRVVEEGALAGETRAFAEGIACGPRLAHAYIKRNFMAAQGGTLQEVLDAEAFHQIRLACSEDHTEAVRAFTEKRKPAFKGR